MITKLFTALVTLALSTLAFAEVKLSEIRADSPPPLVDIQYAELTGIAGESVDGLSLVTIGQAATNSGWITGITSLSGTIPEDRAFTVTNAFWLLEGPDLPLLVEIQDAVNYTVLLIPTSEIAAAGLYVNKDLDLDDDGVIEPDLSFEIIDSIGVKWTAGDSGGKVYGPNIYAAETGIMVFGVRRCLESGEWTGLPRKYGSDIETYGELNPPCGGSTCTPADFNGDSVVDSIDLSMLFGAWGEFDGYFDLNRDGFVGGADLTILLSAWGDCVN